MPLYEYECDACHHRFEVIQRMSGPPVERCPKCGAAVHKLQSAPAFHFKGTGWYVTDYAKKDSSDGSTKEDTGAKSETKSDTTSDAKSDSRSETKESSGKSEKTSNSTNPSPSTDSAASGSSTPRKS